LGQILSSARPEGGAHQGGGSAGSCKGPEPGGREEQVQRPQVPALRAAGIAAAHASGEPSTKGMPATFRPSSKNLSIYWRYSFAHEHARMYLVDSGGPCVMCTTLCVSARRRARVWVACRWGGRRYYLENGCDMSVHVDASMCLCMRCKCVGLDSANVAGWWVP
jgi:hypothetical protein